MVFISVWITGISCDSSLSVSPDNALLNVMTPVWSSDETLKKNKNKKSEHFSLTYTQNSQRTHPMSTFVIAWMGTHTHTSNLFIRKTIESNYIKKGCSLSQTVLRNIKNSAVTITLTSWEKSLCLSHCSSFRVCHFYLNDSKTVYK